MYCRKWMSYNKTLIILKYTDIAIITKKKWNYTQKGIEGYLQRTIKLINEKTKML